mgnify:CR=1 FL=1
MRRDLVAVAALWLVLTVLGEVLAFAFDFQPAPLSDKGEDIKDAVRILTYFAIPVLTFVIAALIYSILRFRATGPEADGTPMQSRVVPWVWLGVTSALAFTIMVFPGLLGTIEVTKGSSGHQHASEGQASAGAGGTLLVQVEGLQWTWLVHYPDQGVRNARELVLPVGQQVTLEVTSRDVLHSFWVPAFMLKIDAIPGVVNHVTFIPTEVGSYEENSLLRLQCAELCGQAHAWMVIPVRVVGQEEFERWVAGQRK